MKIKQKFEIVVVSENIEIFDLMMEEFSYDRLESMPKFDNEIKRID